jgi:broad specificity phosphatase PhoE
VFDAALWLVRHGESTWNTLGLAQGHRDDAELTARGVAQPAAVAEQFRSLQVSAVFSDLYLRAADFCDDLARRLRGTAGKVVVVAHGGTLRVLHAYLSGVAVDQMRWEPMENARVLRIDGFGTNVGGTE